jgi:hypothetical protein
MKLDLKLTTTTIILWVILLPVFSIVHEVGHGLVCDYYGFEPSYHLTLIQNAVTCTGNFSDNLGSQGSFRMAGGFLAASIALGLVISLKSVITPKTRFIAIVLVVIGVTQFFNMTMETYAHEFYINESSVMTIINTLGAMAMLFFLIFRHSDQISYPKYEKIIDVNEIKRKEIPHNVFQRSIVDIIKGRKPKKKVIVATEPEATFASLDLLNDYEDVMGEDEFGDEEEE